MVPYLGKFFLFAERYWIFCRKVLNSNGRKIVLRHSNNLKREIFVTTYIIKIDINNRQYIITVFTCQIRREFIFSLGLMIQKVWSFLAKTLIENIVLANCFVYTVFFTFFLGHTSWSIAIGIMFFYII